MRAEKLRNLLDLLLKRLTAVEARFPKGGLDDAPLTAAKIFELKTALRRHLSKPDALRISAVNDIEHQIDRLRSAASSDLENIHPSSTLAVLLRDLTDEQASLNNLTAGMRIGLNQLEPEDVLETLPGQKSAAFKFVFEDGVFKVVDDALRPHDSEARIAEAALEAAIDQAHFVDGDLAASNTSPRLREAFTRLLQAMVDRKGVVLIGMRASTCSRMIAAASDELSASQAGLLVAHIHGVFNALAQFEEWRVFSEQAAAANVDGASVKTLAQNARDLGEELRKSEVVSREVSDALSTVSNWATETEEPDLRDALSLARTLENCWSAICREALLVRQETASMARKAIAAAIVATFLGTAAMSIPILVKLPGGEWIEFAVSFFRANMPTSPK
ncbi:hypothetical protein [Neorhizobium alkalisoli]|uniref:Uncharacterized protein n=1 Tax=Neorhizobium alkalisoli TaxID=528178 RepID=A0A561Q7U0_9HYPH|nr:hypothetical protein [Neorhizobium alkalisoli]TWF46407.1 hypothetical protein FHW37_115104 [Neorhizobium alkalisoli]